MVEVRFEVFGGGDGVPMVLLHGTGGWGGSFEDVVGLLGLRRRVFVPDLRGHGLSGWGDGYRVVDFSADIARLIEIEIGQPVVVIGHSLGGLVGIALAAMRPELVAGLVIEDAPLWLRRGTVKELSVRAYQFFTSLHGLLMRTRDEDEIRALLPEVAPDAVAREDASLAARLALLDPEVMRQSFDSSLMDGFDLDVAFGQIVCPTLVMQADPAAGGSMLDEDAQAAVGMLRHGSHQFVADAGHMIHRDRPERFVAMVEEWLSK